MHIFRKEVWKWFHGEVSLLRKYHAVFGLTSNYWGLRTKLAWPKHQNLFSSYAKGEQAWNWLFQSGWKSGCSFSTSAWFKGEIFFASHRVHISLAWADPGEQPLLGEDSAAPWEVSAFTGVWGLISICPHAVRISLKWQHSLCSHPPERMSTDKGAKYKITYLRLSNLTLLPQNYCIWKITQREPLLLLKIIDILWKLINVID